MLFNRQIMKYLGSTSLSIYGIIINISTFVQCCAYSIGQASQPIFSINFGAKKWLRITDTLKYCLYTAGFFGILWTALIFISPNSFVRIFMTPTDEINAIAPFIMRSYGISFLLLPLNVFSTYYFQSIMKPKASFFVSVARGLVISGALIYLLPYVMGKDSIWFAMPITEAIVAVIVILLIIKYTRRLLHEKDYNNRA